jgi:hypothetical protein
MLNPNQIEEAYKGFMNNITECAHDGIIQIDLKFLHDTGLLKSIQDNKEDPDDLTQYFHVVESVEKVTLFNEQFVVWIIPQMESDQPVTVVMIALHQEDKAQLEIVYTTKGIYNTPRYVLKVLQHFLLDMLETEATLISIEKSQ